MHFTLESSTQVNNSDYIGNKWTVNVGAVWGQMATGGGSARLNESLAIMEVPGLPKSTFTSIEEEVGKAWAHLLLEETLKAGAEERGLAIERGEFLLINTLFTRCGHISMVTNIFIFIINYLGIHIYV